MENSRAALFQPAAGVASAHLALIRERARRAAEDNVASVQDAASQAALLAVRSLSASSNVTRATINSAQAGLSSTGSLALSAANSGLASAASGASHASAVVGAAAAAARGVVEEKASRLTARQRRYIMWAGVAAAVGGAAVLACGLMRESSMSMSADKEAWWRVCGMEEESCEEALRRKLASSFMSAVKAALNDAHCIADKQALVRSLQGKNTPFDKRSRKNAVRALTSATFSRSICAAYALVIGEAVIAVQVSELQRLDAEGVRLGGNQLHNYLSVLSEYAQLPDGLATLIRGVDKSVSRVLRGYSETTRLGPHEISAMVNEVKRDAGILRVAEEALESFSKLAGSAAPLESALDEAPHDAEQVMDGDDLVLSSVSTSTRIALASPELLARIEAGLNRACFALAAHISASVPHPAVSAREASPPPCGGPAAHGVDGTPPGGDKSRPSSSSPAAEPSSKAPAGGGGAYDWAAGVGECGSTEAAVEGGWGVFPGRTVWCEEEEEDGLASSNRLGAASNTPSSASAACSTPLLAAMAAEQGKATAGLGRENLFKGSAPTVLKLVPVVSSAFGKIVSAADWGSGNPFAPLALGRTFV